MKMTHEEWVEWRKQQARDGQQWRRARLRRIDYQNVSADAATIIDSLRTGKAGSDQSSILNRIVSEWAELTCYRNKIE